MILSFRTKINGKPNYFVEKIIAGLYRQGLINGVEGKRAIKEYFRLVQEPEPKMVFYQGYPKIHTIREDKSDRWQEGKIIDFFINNRTKNAFRFAPRLPVISTQTIFMSKDYDGGMVISIDAKILDDRDKERLAINDGFENYQAFHDYFYPQLNDNFTGKIIHWTDFRYS